MTITGANHLSVEYSNATQTFKVRNLFDLLYGFYLWVYALHPDRLAKPQLKRELTGTYEIDQKHFSGGLTVPRDQFEIARGIPWPTPFNGTRATQFLAYSCIENWGVPIRTRHCQTVLRPRSGLGLSNGVLSIDDTTLKCIPAELRLTQQGLDRHGAT